jgi:tRNA(Ile)-lysidine synthase
MTRRKKPQPRPLSARTSSQRSATLSAFARKLLPKWRGLNLPLANGRVVVAVSGGADSVTLLLALDELVRAKKLALTLVVAHLNHQLRGKESDADAHWVTSLAKELGYAAVIGKRDVQKRATMAGDNLEQAARRVRYEFLHRTARLKKANIVVTGHTLDDQAETILLNLLRGSGADGLTAMVSIRPIEPGGEVLLVRPLLGWARRRDTENYCLERAIRFRSDEMNLDESLARVRVRRQLLPLMETFNPKIVESLTRTGTILRDDSEALSSAAGRLLELSLAPNSREPDSANSVRIDLLRVAPPALRRRALRLWIKGLRGDLRRLEHAHILAVENLFMSTKSGRFVELPDNTRIARRSGRLHYYRQPMPSAKRTRKRSSSY